jgi:F-type H+-transporting ATPase subunit b
MELNPIKQLNPAVIGATIATFTVTYVVMRKTVFLPLIEVMERRHARTLEAEEKYADAERMVAAAEEECTRVRESANEEVRAIVERSKARVDEVREARLAAARTDAERTLEKGRAAIRDEAESERARLRSEAVECVSLSCDKLFGHADRSVVESNVDRVMAKTLH